MSKNEKELKTEDRKAAGSMCPENRTECIPELDPGLLETVSGGHDALQNSSSSLFKACIYCGAKNLQQNYVRRECGKPF